MSWNNKFYNDNKGMKLPLWESIIREGEMDSDFDDEADPFDSYPPGLDMKSMKVKKWRDEGERGEAPSMDSPGESDIMPTSGIRVFIPIQPGANLDSIDSWYRNDYFQDSVINHFDLPQESWVQADIIEENGQSYMYIEAGWEVEPPEAFDPEI